MYLVDPLILKRNLGRFFEDYSNLKKVLLKKELSPVGIDPLKLFGLVGDLTIPTQFQFFVSDGNGLDKGLSTYSRIITKTNYVLNTGSINKLSKLNTVYLNKFLGWLVYLNNDLFLNKSLFFDYSLFLTGNWYELSKSDYTRIRNELISFVFNPITGMVTSRSDLYTKALMVETAFDDFEMELYFKRRIYKGFLEKEGKYFISLAYDTRNPSTMIYFFFFCVLPGVFFLFLLRFIEDKC